VLRLAGAGLLIAIAAIHLDLYLTGYRTIPTIGSLFLFQVIVCFLLAAAVLLGSRLAAAAGALFALSTLGGYLLSIWAGLFGFKEVRTTAGIAAGVIEVVAFAVLAVLALAPPAQHESARHTPADRLMAVLHERAGVGWAATAALSVIAVVLLAVAVAGAGGSSASSGSGGTTVLKAASVGGVNVVTNSKGLTVYFFAPDTPTQSKCYGDCSAYWPPVFGTPKAGPGVTGTLGSIKRSDGTTQATYNGHPLYTYIGDHGPGQANGNNITLNGGLWKDVPVSG
jgi:predicted lipoprotein with Yx(FWY)xxD motif